MFFAKLALHKSRTLVMREHRLSDIPRRSIRRTAHDASDAVLVTNAADLAVGESIMSSGEPIKPRDWWVWVSYTFGGVIAALIGREIGVFAFNIEREPMRPAVSR